MDRLLDLAVDHGFDRYIAAGCLARLAEILGEDGQPFLTVENCGEDFLSALADAIQATEDWDHRGSSNEMVINSSSDDKGRVAATNRPLFRKADPFTSKKVKADLSTSKTRKANSTSESICDNFSTDDSDIEMLDEMDKPSSNSVSVQRNTRSRNPELQRRSSENSEDASKLSGAGEQELLQLTMWF